MRPGERAGDFGGTSDYLTLGSDLTGDGDGKTGIFSAWLRVDGGNGTARYCIGNAAARFYMVLLGNNTFRFVGRTSVPADVLNMNTSAKLAGPSWIHILASWALAAAATHLYVDDASDNNTVTADNDTIDYTRAGWAIAIDQGLNLPYHGALSEFYFAPNQYLDFSVEANRRKFVRDTVRPSNLGADGSWPTGTAPLIYMPDPSSGVNLGTGGDFTKQGAPLSIVGPSGINPNHKVARV